MNEYLSVGKKILKILINNGFEAYFIGEAVRNSILKKDIVRVDITTSAHLGIVKKIFEDLEFEDLSENEILLKFDEYYFYVQSFLTNYKHEKNALSVKHYSKNLLDDLANRDFTINAIAMSHSGKLTDAYDGYNDILKKKISHIGNAKTKFAKNPTLMIKAFALMSELNYKLSTKTSKAINRRRKNLLKCDSSLYMDDLKKIINGPYAKKAILMMNKTNIDLVLPTIFKKTIRRLGKKYRNINFEEFLLMSFVENKQLDRKYEDYIEDVNIFNKIYDLAVNNRYSEYNSMTLFSNGLEICLEANYINFLVGKCALKEKKIKKQWNALPIKSYDDLQFGYNDLKRIIRPNDYYVIDEILEDVVKSIFEGQVINKFNEIQTIVITLLENKNILYDLNMKYEFNNHPKQEPIVTISKNEELGLNKFNNDDNENEEIQILKQQLEEQQRLLAEQGKKLKEAENNRRNQSIKEIASKSANLVIDDEQLKDVIKDNDDFQEQLHKFIADYINEEEDN